MGSIIIHAVRAAATLGYSEPLRRTLAPPQQPCAVSKYRRETLDGCEHAVSEYRRQKVLTTLIAQGCLDCDESYGMARRCSAHSRRDGEPCGHWAVRGKNVCRLHGGLSTGWRGQRSDDHLAAMHRGRERWLVHRMERKAAGL